MTTKKTTKSDDSETVESTTPETAPKSAEPVKETASLETPGPNDAVAANTAHVPRGGKVEAMRNKLAAEPKVRVLIPLTNGEKAGVTQSVILNGYSLYIRKGDYVEVPKSVAEVLDIKLKHKLAVDNHPLKVDGNHPVKMDSYGS
jgi:hypothetical protein